MAVHKSKMAGFYDRLDFDPSKRKYDAYESMAQSGYYLNTNAVFRFGSDTRPLPLGVGVQPDRWGPARGVVTTRESFLQGRGQILSKAPEAGVKWLPESLFPNVPYAPSQCQRTDLQQLQTRQPRSCNNLSGTDSTQYWMSASAYQKGYTGFRSVVDTNMQSRDPPEALGAGGESYGACAKSYGSYGVGRAFPAYY